MTIHIHNRTVTPVPDAKQFQHWARLALAHCQCDKELSIEIIDSAAMTLLNDTFRNKPKPTNVLSFPNTDPYSQDYLGDIAICVDVIAEEAKQQNKTITNHFAHMTIHGVLHLLGYDHIEDSDADMMESLEVMLLQRIDIDDPYQTKQT